MSEKTEQIEQGMFLPEILLLQVNITVKTNYIHFLKRELKFNWILRLP